ncbi:MAG TPA: hypothetical protein PLT45_06350 [Smithella sp.]|nr:hypothetical protein [Smithella sp.]
MKTTNSLLIFTVSLWFVALLSSAVSAEQPVTGPKANTRVVQPLPPLVQEEPASTRKVLQVPIHVTEALVNSMSLYNNLMFAIDRVQKAYSPLKFHDCQGGWPFLEETYYGGYKSYVKQCANKSYSVQDQQNAGCVGSETLNQCTNKLFKYCLSRYEQDKGSYTQTQETLKSKITKGIEKSDKINNEAKELSDALRVLQSLMP